jgi:asparagine synthase (glutamine-hydrolysing)
MDADVPLGTFLSGGVDSSIVSAIAAQNKDGLHTFSIGFNENQFFDETKYSKLVAQHIGSIHHPIQLNNSEIVANFNNVLDSFDEPFADPSAIAMYFLSKGAKKDLTVCLSGDGADELLAGYNKHKAFQKSKNVSFPIQLIAKTARLSKNQGRNGKIQNTLRQLSKFGDLLDLKWPDNYWMLAQFSKEKMVEQLLRNPSKYDLSKYEESIESLNSFLLMDQHFVLPNDMLKKVDVMSMQNSLEVRTPFLDKEFVHFCNSLPESLKLSRGQGKSILRQACSDLLPDEIFTRSKKGFEVPLHSWISGSWDQIVNESWFDKSFLETQNIFNVTFVSQLKNKFFSKNPGDSVTLIWSYIVFQYWYAKWMTKK